MITITNKKQYEEKLAELQDLKTAKKKILLGAQSYTIGAQQLNRANLAEVNKEINELEAALDQYERCGSTKRKTKRFVPL
jgi:hypothetical protein